VIVSHWHADHIGGLRDFPEAIIHTSHAAWNSIQELNGFAALRRAFLPGLVPDDAASRLNWIREGDDPFGDGSLQVLDLPGHAVGQVGVRFTAEDGAKILLAADACWLSDAYRKNFMPHSATRIVNDWEPYRASLDRLHRLHRMEADLLIVPCHCPETAARIAIEHA
jgi:glyoxylase-like metal-dependent hydrolase (beta-lactamase superfamily II)